MKINTILFICVIIFFHSITYNQLTAQPIKLGAYYFDGWTGKSNFHLNKNLTDSFPERKPIWGWTTSTANIMTKQIDIAAEAGLSFFSFCWYFKNSKDSLDVDSDVKNNALHLFIKATNKNRMQFNLMVANHTGYVFQEKDWPNLCKYWCTLFKDPSYLKVDNKPFITFFSLPFLLQTFKNKEKLIKALGILRSMAKKEGFDDVLIGANISTYDLINLAEICGFDVLTGYNSHGYAKELSFKKSSMPVDSMRTIDSSVWNNIVKKSNLPILPNITLNWDPRSVPKINVRQSLRFTGFSGTSVKTSILQCRQWMKSNKANVLDGNLAILYAWNEYGEGAWLTPSAKLKNSLLEGVKAGLMEN